MTISENFQKALFGGYGGDVVCFLLAVILFLLGTAVFYISPGQYIHLSGVSRGDLMYELFEGRPIEGVLLGAGILSTFGTILLFIKRLIS